ncbi:type II toxin-antitoxin system RelE/ParE family toxin [Fusibacter ferrireducens]|uniref:type II toxin-antitoxin system RelE/ParE family toxin n=1 Tax=Fusibacter ferrireducens TaxID=2785058 RepID=UPI002B4AA1DA|nr:type II toxin-antitoxin system RelE/ParE family toxin [Fusibacter ferrireducens]
MKNVLLLIFLKQFLKRMFAKILREIELLEEFGLSLGMLHIKKITDTKALWELRFKQSTNSYRVFYSAKSNDYSFKYFSKENSKDTR